LRISTAGSVDDGKSTLIGRLLRDSKNVYDDHLAALEQKAIKRGSDEIDLSLLTDGLKAEQEQGITIDVAYRYFSTPRRRFILADTPGHEQYTRNMATGASTADLTIILIDARKGALIQTKRHSLIASLLGVPRLIVAVNKMDLVDYSEERFNQIVDDYSEFAAKLGITEIKFIPVSALRGDNIVERSRAMPWYAGESILEHLESVFVAGDSNQVDFRFPVQFVIRPNQDYRGYAGQIRSGHIRVGDEVLALPSYKRSRVRSIDYLDPDPAKRSLPAATVPQSITISLEDELDISRGDMLVRPRNVPESRQEFEAMLVWMAEEPLDLRRSYIIHHTSRETRGVVTEMAYRMEMQSLHREKGSTLNLNEIGRISIRTAAPLFIDTYERNRATGNFILVDPNTLHTVAAGMCLDRVSTRQLLRHEQEEANANLQSSDLHRAVGTIDKHTRESRAGYRAVTVWCTGLSGSGKSTIAQEVEARLFALGRPIYRLDGDNLRHGLNGDLGFSLQDRSENIRRTAEVAKLFNDAGVSVICSLISPLAEDRARARAIIGEENFVEVYISTPLAECEGRDPHGLYKKARAGELKSFTGIDSPYEAPTSPALTLDTSRLSLEQSAQAVLDLLLGENVFDQRTPGALA
jgi:bifunctional enzyme CysN/CysC